MARKRKTAPLPEKMPATVDEAVDFALTFFGQYSFSVPQNILKCVQTMFCRPGKPEVSLSD